MVNSLHVSRCAAVALAGFTALSLAACGSSGAPSPSAASSKSSTATTAPPAPSASSTTPTPGAAGRDGKDKAFGLVGSVSGGTVTLTGPKGPATVDVTPSTRVIEFTPGQLTDVTAGECVLVRPTKHGGGQPTVTAAAVLVGQADNGQCGGGGGGHGREHGVSGTVASVSGSSIVLTATDNSQTTVAVSPDTRYTKRSTADTSAISAGQCLAARGAKDGSGNLQATEVNLRPADNGQCGGGRHHRG
jgi:Domain of unknown function (DUF5666)